MIKLPPFIVTLGTLKSPSRSPRSTRRSRPSRAAPDADLPRQDLPARSHRRHLRLGADAGDVRGGLVRPAPDLGRSAHLCRRQQPRGRTAERHRHVAEYCSPCTRSPARSTASPRCCWSRAPVSAIRTPGRPTTWTRSPRWSSVAPACSADAVRLDRRHPARRADRRHDSKWPDAHRCCLGLPDPHHRHAGDRRGGRGSVQPWEAAMSEVDNGCPATPGPAGERTGQTIRSGHRPGRLRFRSAARRDTRGDRRQRRGQIDFDQGTFGRHRAGRRRDSARRQAGAIPQAPRRTRSGIETVYQELAVAPAMSIAENLFLARELRRRAGAVRSSR